MEATEQLFHCAALCYQSLPSSLLLHHSCSHMIYQTDCQATSERFTEEVTLGVIFKSKLISNENKLCLDHPCYRVLFVSLILCAYDMIFRTGFANR